MKRGLEEHTSRTVVHHCLSVVCQLLEQRGSVRTHLCHGERCHEHMRVASHDRREDVELPEHAARDQITRILES